MGLSQNTHNTQFDFVSDIVVTSRKVVPYAPSDKLHKLCFAHKKGLFWIGLPSVLRRGNGSI